MWLNFEDVMVEPRRTERPSTAGVHVTEHQLDKINPSPVAIDETELLIEEFLSPRKLVSMLISYSCYMVMLYLGQTYNILQ